MQGVLHQLFVWHSEYSLGIPDVDSQHRNLFRLGALLDGLVGRGAGRQEIAPCLSALASAMRAHFDLEEKFMSARATAGYASHRADHERVYATVASLVPEVSAGRADVSTTVLESIDSWVCNHIVTADRTMAAELA